MPSRGTAPKPILACFVHYLEIINTFLKGIKLSEKLKNGTKILVGQTLFELLTKIIILHVLIDAWYYCCWLNFRRGILGEGLLWKREHIFENKSCLFTLTCSISTYRKINNMRPIYMLFKAKSICTCTSIVPNSWSTTFPVSSSGQTKHMVCKRSWHG